MKTMSLALIAAMVLSGQTLAQPSAQTSNQTKTTYSPPHSHECKKQVNDLCGRRPKGELQSCLKDGLDLNKFTDSCKAEIANPAKSAS
jgi:hypothetical protein